MQGDGAASDSSTTTQPNGNHGAQYRPPPMPASRAITEAHTRHLHTSGLTDDTIRAANLYSIESRDETIALLGRTYALHAGPAFVIPFYEPGAAEPYAYRVRPDHPRYDAKRKRSVKYDQPTGAGIMVYYPPRTRASGELRGSTRLVWTEGEKKALALDQLGYTAVGLTGVDGWSAPRGATNPSGEKPPRELHPRILDHVNVAGRDCVIAFDQDAIEKPAVMRALRALIRALLEAGAAEVRVALPPAGDAKGIDDYYAQHGEQAVRDLIERDAALMSASDPESAEDTPISKVEALAGAPCPDGSVVPRGYQVSATGRVLAQTDERSVVVGPRPIVITGRAADHITGEQSATVAWRDERGGWRSATVSRRALVDTRAMVAELAPLGAPITSQAARHWVAWFLAWELANESVLPMTQSTQRTGWIGEPGIPGAVFVAHATHGYTLTGEAERLAVALKPRGDAERHLEALRRAWDTGPVMRRVLCAVLAAPLLKPLRARGFAVHLCGDSSRGKTTMARIAASVFGDPDHPAWVSTWNSTANAAELRAATLCDLPLIYDEIGAADPVAVQRLVYTLVNGESRGRMTSTLAAQRARSWRTVVVSTGEVPIADDLATGAQARVLTFDVAGFGTLDGDAPAIAKLLQDCTDHCGGFGARWLTDLAALGLEEWQRAADLRALYRGIYLNGEAKAGARSRVADCYALLGVVEALLVGDYGFPDHGTNNTPSVCSGVHLEGVDPEPIESAADAMATEVDAWIASQPDAFPVAQMQSLTQVREPVTLRGGVRLGVRVVDTEERLIEVWINPRALKDLFAKHRRSFRSVLREWQRQNRVESADESGMRRADPHRRVGQNRARFVVWRPRE